MKKILTVLMMMIVGCFCLSAETVKGKYYENGTLFEETWSYYPVKDENGVFTLSEVQKLLASLGWNEYVAIGSIDDYRDAIVEMCAYDHVEYQEDNNLLEVKAIGGDTPLQMYIFQIDEACSRALNFKDGFNSLMLVRKF